MSERQGKYNARKSYEDGYTFDSQAEGRRYRELRMLKQAGQIEGLVVHPRYVVWTGRDKTGKAEKIIYVGDFQYSENGRLIVEDVKGVQTVVFALKAKMFRCAWPDVELRVVK